MPDTTLDAPADLAAFPAVQAVHPRYGDLGPDGDVDLVAVARWFEDARVGAAVASFRRLAGGGGLEGHRILLASQRVDRLDRVAAGTEHRVGIGVRRIGRSSFTYGYALFAGERCVATGETVTVVATAEGPAVLPDGLRDDLAAMGLGGPDGPPADRPGPERRERGAYPDGLEVRARLGDVDTNRHGNNVALIGWYTDAVAAWQLDRLGATPGGPPPALAPTSLAVQYVAEVAYPGTYRLGVRPERDGDVVRYACGLFAGERCVGLADLAGPDDPAFGAV